MAKTHEAKTSTGGTDTRVIDHQHADYPSAADLAIRIARLTSTK